MGMSTANDPPLHEDPLLTSEAPLVEETSASAVGAPAEIVVEAPPLTAAEELVKLRASVEQKLQAVVAGEQQLRQRTQELKQRLSPIRKQIDTLTRTLQLDSGVFADLRNTAAAEIQQQVTTLRTLTIGLDEETQLRIAMTEAGRLQLRQRDQLTLQPVEAWKQSTEAWNQSLVEAKEALALRLDEFSDRWLSALETEASTAPDATSDNIEDAAPSERTDSGETVP
jgi:hypothetical protein